jgi:hypothetical protein
VQTKEYVPYIHSWTTWIENVALLLIQCLRLYTKLKPTAGDDEEKNLEADSVPCIRLLSDTQFCGALSAVRTKSYKSHPPLQIDFLVPAVVWQTPYTAVVWQTPFPTLPIDPSAVSFFSDPTR